jgi:AraC family transcriptional regulator
MSDLECVYKVLLLIEENYNKEISISQLENASNYSYRNVQRIFKKIFKETIGEFKTRLKLEKGYKLLLYTEDEIMDISIAIGYESNQSFSKAFKKKYNFTPKEARDKREELFDQFIERRDNEISKVTIEFYPARKVKSKLLLTNDYDNPSINELWQKIYSTSEKERNSYFGLIIDQPLISIKAKCRYEACFDSVTQTNEKYEGKTILGRKYAKYTHLGSYDTILETYRRIYFDWLYNQSYEMDSTPIVEHYQVGPVNTLNDEEFVTDILIPIK